MATIPELLDGHVTLEVECLDRLYLNGYIGKLATGGGLIGFMYGQLGKPVPSPVILGQISERFRDSVKSLAERDSIPLYQFNHKERKDDIANEFRRQRQFRDGIVFIGVAQEKAQAFSGKKVNGLGCTRSTEGSGPEAKADRKTVGSDIRSAADLPGRRRHGSVAGLLRCLQRRSFGGRP